MAYDAFFERVLFAGAAVLIVAGALSAWTSINVTRKLGGVFVAMLGGLIALAVLGAPAWIIAAGGAVALAQMIMGGAIAVRLHEGYGSSEISEADKAEAEAERAQ